MAVQKRTAFATIAVVAGIVGLFVSPVAGFFLGILAVLFGALAVLRAASPQKSGAIAGLVGIALGVTAIIVKIIAGVLHILF